MYVCMCVCLCLLILLQPVASCELTSAAEYVKQFGFIETPYAASSTSRDAAGAEAMSLESATAMIADDFRCVSNDDAAACDDRVDRKRKRECHDVDADAVSLSKDKDCNSHADDDGDDNDGDDDEKLHEKEHQHDKVVKPYNSSGRQPHEIVKVRSHLREGFTRYLRDSVS